MATRADTDKDVSDLLVQLVGVMRQQFMAVAADLDLTPPQLGVLKHLVEPIPMSRLAGEMHCDASNITWMTDRLEERGLVERRPDPLDRRVKQLVLTEAGQRLRRQIDRRLGTKFPGLDRLSGEERQTLARLLSRLLDA